MSKSSPMRGSGGRKKIVVVERKVDEKEWDEHRLKMEDLGLDPTVDPMPLPDTGEFSGAGMEDPQSLSFQEEMYGDEEGYGYGGAGGGRMPGAVAIMEQEKQQGSTAMSIKDFEAQQDRKMQNRYKKLQKLTIEEKVVEAKDIKMFERWKEQEADWEAFRRKAGRKLGRKKE